MSPIIREATRADVPRMVELSAAKRSQYEGFEPVFWRKAEKADEKQAAFFEAQLDKKNITTFVFDRDGILDGFLVAAVIPAPPVYDPGGPTCVIDDFCVADPGLWPTTGGALLAETRGKVRPLGAVQVVVMCGEKDWAKRSFLDAEGYGTATQIRVKDL